MVTREEAIKEEPLGQLAPGGEASVEPLMVSAVEGEPEYQAPSIKPETTADTATITPPAPAVTIAGPLPADDYVRRRLAYADQLEQRQREIERTAAVNQHLARIRADAETRGLDNETQDWLVRQVQGIVESSVDDRRRFQAEMEYHQSKLSAAQVIGQQFGVAPQALMTANTLDEMRAIAAREKRYMDNERRIEALEKSKVPPQHMNTTGISKVGGLAVTSDNIDALWIQGRVSDETYRRFLETKQIR